MSDSRIREAERSGDRVRWIAECRRAGIVTENDCRERPEMDEVDRWLYLMRSGGKLNWSKGRQLGMTPAWLRNAMEIVLRRLEPEA